MNEATFSYGEDFMSVGSAIDLCENKIKGILSDKSINNINKSAKIVRGVLENDRPVYGINTGFGSLCTTIIDTSEVSKLQHNLLKSHAVGVGERVPVKIAKLMMILKVQALSYGYSGVSLETIGRIRWHIQNEIIPVVPNQGSLGASGDLAPLAHLFLPLIGLGHVYFDGQVYPAEEILTRHHLEPLTLGPKEALGLINGTQFMVAYGIMILHDLQNCLDNADFIAAMMIEALQGSEKPFHPGIHQLRPHRGVQYVSQRMTTLLCDSEIMQSHLDCDRVQDPYSLRCVPQVHGASRDTFLYGKKAIETEINSVTDNPIVLNENEIISAGNFHGQPIALPLDFLAVAAAELGNISDRRIFLAFEGKYEGLPALLMKETGLNSGFMIVQYTTAALVSENKTLSHPASVDSIPTSMGQEDHVSMGSIAARKTYKIVQNLEKILALELLCACQGLDFRRPLKSSVWIDGFHKQVRLQIKHRYTDDLFIKDIDSAISIIQNRELISSANKLSESKGIPLTNENHELYGIY